MRIHIATDHAGLEFSTQLIHHLAEQGHDVVDLSLIHISEPTRQPWVRGSTSAGRGAARTSVPASSLRLPGSRPERLT